MAVRCLKLAYSVSAIALLAAQPVGAQQQVDPASPQSAKAEDITQSAPGTAPVVASTPNQTDPTDMTESAEDIVVTGFRSAETKEIAAKRSSIEITDGISSDDLGRIPDLNIGEAMQRIPGIQINREGEGREASVNLRGLPGEYARTTMNGVSFAEPILQGSTPFGAYLSNVFSGVRIEKSQLAHSIAGGLSGNIDLQIAPALSRQDGFRVNAAIDYNELGKRWEPNFAVGGNKRITDDLAVFGTFAFKREHFRKDSLFINAYGTLTPAAVANGPGTAGSSTNTPDFLARYADYYAPATLRPGTNQYSTSCTGVYAGVAGCVPVIGGTGAKAVTGIQYPNQTRQYMRDTKGSQYSASGGVEWKPDDRWTLGVVGLYTNRNQKDTTQSFQTLNFTGNGAVINPTGEIKEGPNGTFFVDSFDYSNVNNITDNRILPTIQRAWGLNGTIQYEDDDWKSLTTGTYSKAFASIREMYVSLSKTPQGVAVNNGINGSFYSGSGNWNDYNLLINDFTVGTLVPSSGAWTQAAVNPAVAGYNPTNQSNYYDRAVGAPGRTTFRITGTQSEAGSTLMALQQDFEKKVHDSFLSAIKGGLRWERTEFTSAGSKVSGFGINPAGIDPNLLVTNPDLDGFLGGSIDGVTPYWKTVDVKTMFESIGPARVAPGTSLNEFGLNNEYADDVNVARFNFSNTTSVMSAYAEAQVDTEILSMPLKGSVGARYEATTQQLDVLSRLTPYDFISYPIGSIASFTNRTLKNDYDYLLPSGILILEPAKNFLVRFAAYKTYVRPHPRQFSPSTVVGAVNPVAATVDVTLGNPDLRPYTGTSYDLSAEWYNRPGGVIALSLFQKTFDGLIQQVRGAALCPGDGGGLGFGGLITRGDQCIAPGYLDGTDLVVNVTGNENSPTPIRVRGIEANVKQNLDFLPGILSHFGGGATYGYTEISGTLPNGQPASLAGVSKHNFNVLGYYDTSDFGLRLTYNYRTAYDVPDQVIFGFGGLARRVAARGQLDGSANVNITPDVTLSFSAFNILNAKRIEYQGIEELARRFDYDGRTFRLAMNVSF